LVNGYYGPLDSAAFPPAPAGEGSNPLLYVLRAMETKAASSSSPLTMREDRREEEDDLYGAGAGWVEARTTCDHLGVLSSDLSHIPPPDTSCTRCYHPAENWLCLSCKDVLCSRFINKHMLTHHQETGHSIALSYSDLSVWCFACESYLDAQAILQLQHVYEVAHLLKFGVSPPTRPVEHLQVGLQSQQEERSAS
ncbi:hypothetical protein Taro_002154, partial [Colocasia esculenta]|nr:hypothetical protein [Colocasia esculenta]